MNSGNGAAGPTFNAIATALGQNAPQIEFIRVHHQPDHTFPNGIPNPLLPENHAATADVVMENDANLGVAFDGDFDRCFFLDEKGQFIDGEYIVGVLADVFLDKVPEASIVHDPRIIWNTQSVVTVERVTMKDVQTHLSFLEAEAVEILREVAKLMKDAGLIVITAFISSFRSERQMLRDMMAPGEFVEVVVDTPLSVAEERDVKGLHAKARSGQLKNFTRIDSPYEAPETPEIHIDTTAMSIDDAAEQIVKQLLS